MADKDMLNIEISQFDLGMLIEKLIETYGGWEEFAIDYSEYLDDYFSGIIVEPEKNNDTEKASD